MVSPSHGGAVAVVALSLIIGAWATVFNEVPREATVFGDARAPRVATTYNEYPRVFGIPEIDMCKCVARAPHVRVLPHVAPHPPPAFAAGLTTM